MYSKVCPICNQEFYKRDGEDLYHFNRRKTCSKECANSLRSITESKTNISIYKNPPQLVIEKVPPKMCIICGEAFTIKDNESLRDFNKRQTCSADCKSILLSRQSTKFAPDVKICPICNKEFFIRSNEKPVVYNKRKTCSPECAAILRGQTTRINYAKTCVVCGQEFFRREDEVSTDFRNRQTCSKECAKKLASKNSQHTMQEKYGVPYFCLTKECREYKNISKINLEFSSLLTSLNIEHELEYTIDTSSYDIRVGNTLLEINPWPFHNINFSPVGKPVDKNYHQRKSQLAVKHGFRCVHVWDWDNYDKIISMLLPKETLYARKLDIKEIPMSECRAFLIQNHLQNDTRSMPIRIGLYNNEELIMAMTFGKPRFNKNYDYELLRLCTKAGYKVVGGAQRIFKYFLTRYNHPSIISYCDMSKFTGEVYYDLGFNLFRENPPSRHWYRADGKHFTDAQLRQHGFDRLVGREYNVSYGKGSSNEELMKIYNFVEIFDSGQNTYHLERNN